MARADDRGDQPGPPQAAAGAAEVLCTRVGDRWPTGKRLVPGMGGGGG